MNFASFGEERRTLLARAKHAFEARGVIPADIAARLMALGVIVPDLEHVWSRDGFQQ